MSYNYLELLQLLLVFIVTHDRESLFEDVLNMQKYSTVNLVRFLVFMTI